MLLENFHTYQVVLMVEYYHTFRISCTWAYILYLLYQIRHILHSSNCTTHIRLYLCHNSNQVVYRLHFYSCTYQLFCFQHIVCILFLVQEIHIHPLTTRFLETSAYKLYNFSLLRSYRHTFLLYTLHILCHHT